MYDAQSILQVEKFTLPFFASEYYYLCSLYFTIIRKPGL